MLNVINCCSNSSTEKVKFFEHIREIETFCPVYQCIWLLFFRVFKFGSDTFQCSCCQQKTEKTETNYISLEICITITLTFCEYKERSGQFSATIIYFIEFASRADNKQSQKIFCSFSRINIIIKTV